MARICIGIIAWRSCRVCSAIGGSCESGAGSVGVVRHARIGLEPKRRPKTLGLSCTRKGRNAATCEARQPRRSNACTTQTLCSKLWCRYYNKDRPHSAIGLNGPIAMLYSYGIPMAPLPRHQDESLKNPPFSGATMGSSANSPSTPPISTLTPDLGVLTGPE